MRVSAVDEILARIDAKRSFSSDTLDLTEQGKALVTSETIWKTLQTVPPDSLTRLGLKLDIDLKGVEIKRLVQSSNIIGSARVASEFGELSINIEPKAAVDRLVAIIDYIQRDSYFSSDSTEAYSGYADLLTLQVIRCLRLILRTLSSGSVRGYREVTTDLRFVKGRADYCRLLSQLAIQAQSSIRCTYFEHSIDIERNRIFKSSLIKIAKFLSERDAELFELARLAAYSLSTVQERPFSRNEIERLARRSTRDAAVLLACRDILCDLSISPHPNHARPFFSYAINMATLFQDYVNRLVINALGSMGGRPLKKLIYPIEGSSKEIKLDGLFEGNNKRLLVESKYKLVHSIDDSSRDDIYQTIAYCAHAEVAPEFAILFYPAESGSSSLKTLGTISGFRIPCSHINLVSINLSTHPLEAQASTQIFLTELLGK